jgi:prevent-host-death family protein
MEVSVRELKAHLSEYLRRAQAGEEITIRSRQEVVGRLVAPAAEPDNERDEMEAALARLRAQPWVRAPEKEGKPQGARQPIPADPGENLSAELLERD